MRRLLNISARARWGGILVCLLASSEITGQPAPDSPDRAAEESVKAVMTSVIVQSSQWPDGAFVSKTSPFHIGLYGKDPPVKEFKEAFKGVRIQDRRVEVVVVRHDRDITDLHAIYFSTEGLEEIAKLLGAFAGKPTLTFGDHDGFIERGGIVNFRKIDGRVRFEFGRTAMEGAGIRVNAKVIRLALPSQNGGTAE